MRTPPGGDGDARSVASRALEDTVTADVSSPYADAAPARHTGLRVVVGLLGLAAVVVGIVLLIDPVAAARTLALLLGLSLVLGGLLEIAAGWESGRRFTSAVL